MSGRLKSCSPVGAVSALPWALTEQDFPYLGHVVGVATSGLWVATSLFFTAGGKRIGSTPVNAFRMVVAIVLHLIMLAAMTGGSIWPEVTQQQLLWLAISGLVGLTICDQCLFTAFIDIGPRKALLCMTTSPLFALGFGAAFLGERVGWLGLLGIAITLGGVAWVILERDASRADRDEHPHAVRGVILAFIGAATQAAGSLASKKGIGHGIVDPEQHLDPQAATYIRLIFGLLGMLPILLVYWASLKTEKHRRAKARRIGSKKAGYAFTAAGAVVGPFLGVWGSLVAFDLLDIGIAQTLVSLSPVMILPFAVFVQKEHVSPRAILGALLAVVGSALLFLT